MALISAVFRRACRCNSGWPSRWSSGARPVLIHPCGKGSDGGSSGLLESMGQLQDARLSKSGPKDLQAHGQLSVDLPARNGGPRASRQRPSNRIYISKIHLERVGRTLAQFERRNRRSRRQDGIHLCKRIAEILGNERANLLPLQVVGVVVARRKHIRAQHDAAFYLFAKPGAARLAI